MSALKTRRSSSSRSMRSMNERNLSPAIPPTSGMVPSTPLALASRQGSRSVPMRSRERRLLRGARLVLVLRLPFLVRHAVDDLAGLRVGQRHAALLRLGQIPFRQAVPAESGEVHQVDVLHVGALAQMRDETAEGRRLELDTGLVVHADLHLGALRIMWTRRGVSPMRRAPALALELH